MKKLIKTLLITLALVVCVNTAVLNWQMLRVDNQLAFNGMRAEIDERAILAMAEVLTPSSEMIQQVMPSAVAIEIYTGNIIIDLSTRTIQPQIVKGSGVITDDAGTVLTVKHIAEAMNATDKAVGVVTLPNGKQYQINRVAVDPNIDVALIRIDPNEVCQAVRVAINPPRVGDPIWAIGNPFGYSFTVTTGIISSYRDPNGLGQGSSIQVDAPLNPGNSGSPVFDRYGNLIGIAEGIVPGPVSCGVNFIISASQIAEVYPRLLEELYK